MAIVRNVSVFQSLLLASAIALVGCGGGGGGGSKSSSSNSIASSSSVAAPDTTPNAFAFSGITNAEPGVTAVSSAIEITGINTPTAISIAGGEYAIDGGEFSSAVGTINNGQTLTIRTIASDKTNTSIDVTVTVGGVSATFTVTTLADVTPDTFSFAAKTDVAVNTEETSESVTIKGIDIAVPVSITGGLYSINGGEFTASAGTVSVDQTIAVKTTSATSTDTTQNAVLNVGGVSATFAVTTIPDITPPVAEFKFPTPYTMSEANEVKVRGVATDDNAITEVKLMVRSYSLATPDVTIETDEVIATPKSEIDGVKDFSSWTASIPLTADAENEIKVVAVDDRDNEIVIEQANKVVIRQADGFSSFPNGDNQFASISGGMVIDELGGRNRLLVSDTNESRIFSVSINSGERTVYKDLKADSLNDVAGLLIDASADEAVLYAVEYSYGKLHKINLSTGVLQSTYQSDLYISADILVMDTIDGSKSLVSINRGDSAADEATSDVVRFDLGTESFSVIFSDLNHPGMPVSDFIALDKTRNRYLVSVRDTAVGLYGIYSVDRLTGERKPISTNDVGAGELFIDRTALQELAVDVERNTVYVPDYLTGKLFAIDLVTGDRRVVTNLAYKNANNEPLRIRLESIQADFDDQFAFVGDDERDSILVVDLTSGERVILSKAENN